MVSHPAFNLFEIHTTGGFHKLIYALDLRYVVKLPGQIKFKAKVNVKVWKKIR